jgi:TonB family protein
MRVGTRLMGLKIVRRIEPVYPEIAMQTRLATNIALEATLDEAGDVKEVHILRGHPLLNEAALNAVERWKFGQTLLNGTPVRVITTIILPFKNHGKLDPEIAALMFRFQKDAQHDPAKNEFVSGGMATVDLILTEWSPQNIRNLRDLGFLPSGQSQDVKSLTGRMPVEKLSSLLRLKAIDFIALHRNK